MFKKKPPAEPSALDKAIDELITVMRQADEASDDYKAMTKRLDTLYKLKEVDHKTPDRRVSPDTLAMIAGNLLIAVIVVGHERAHVVTSKALQFMSRAR